MSEEGLLEKLPSFARADGACFCLFVRAKPGVRKERPLALVPVAPGGMALEVSVSAPAVDGKANEAVIKRLAREVGVRPSAFTLKSGETARVKQVLFAPAKEADAHKFRAFCARINQNN